MKVNSEHGNREMAIVLCAQKPSTLRISVYYVAYVLYIRGSRFSRNAIFEDFISRICCLYTSECLKWCSVKSSVLKSGGRKAWKIVDCQVSYVMLTASSLHSQSQFACASVQFCYLHNYMIAASLSDPHTTWKNVCMFVSVIPYLLKLCQTAYVMFCSGQNPVYSG